MHYVEKNNPEYTTKKKKQLIKAIVTILAAGAGGGLAYLILSHFTPQARIDRARVLVTEIDRESLMHGQIGLPSIQGRFSSSDIPLVDTIDESKTIGNKIRQARHLITAACQEDAGQTIDGQGLRGELDRFSHRTMQLRQYILNNHGVAYRNQLTVSKNRQERERKIRVEEKELERKRKWDEEKLRHEREKLRLANRVVDKKDTKINLNL